MASFKTSVTNDRNVSVAKMSQQNMTEMFQWKKTVHNYNETQVVELSLASGLSSKLSYYFSKFRSWTF